LMESAKRQEGGLIAIDNGGEEGTRREGRARWGYC
jgi:hypothetical protein